VLLSVVAGIYQIVFCGASSFLTFFAARNSWAYLAPITMINTGERAKQITQIMTNPSNPLINFRKSLNMFIIFPFE